MFDTTRKATQLFAGVYSRLVRCQRCRTLRNEVTLVAKAGIGDHQTREGLYGQSRLILSCMRHVPHSVDSYEAPQILPINLVT